jgi:DNA-binding transcriptional MocR family regulator
LFPGDVVAVESPTYFGILEMIESLGMQSLPVPSTCRLGLDLDVLEKSLRKFHVAACLLIPSFGNPNGACMTQERRERLAGMLAKDRIPLIEDDFSASTARSNGGPTSRRRSGLWGNWPKTSLPSAC